VTEAVTRGLALKAVADHSLALWTWTRTLEQSATLLCRVAIWDCHVVPIRNCPSHTTIHACFPTPFRVDVCLIAVGVCSCLGFELSVLHVQNGNVEGMKRIHCHSKYAVNKTWGHAFWSHSHSSGSVAVVDYYSISIPSSSHEVWVAATLAMFYIIQFVSLDPSKLRKGKKAFIRWINSLCCLRGQLFSLPMLSLDFWVRCS